jgi:hypothetical protein
MVTTPPEHVRKRQRVPAAGGHDQQERTDRVGTTAARLLDNGQGKNTNVHPDFASQCQHGVPANTATLPGEQLTSLEGRASTEHLQIGQRTHVAGQPTTTKSCNDDSSDDSGTEVN